MQFADIAADVPFLAVPPIHERPESPVVIAWHLLSPPRSEAAFAAALPLAGLDAWRIYLGLPLCGSRSPGPDEIIRLATADAVRNLFGPIADQAVAEFPAAYQTLRDRFRIDGQLALVGGSLGAAVAQAVTIGRDDVAAAVLVSPVTQLRPIVEANARQFGATYAWSVEADRIADRLDFVARADAIARSGPAVRIVVGADDDVDSVLKPASALHDGLAQRYADPSRVDLVSVPGMGHALADEPGVDPAPPLAAALEVDRLAVMWLRSHLS